MFEALHRQANSQRDCLHMKKRDFRDFLADILNAIRDIDRFVGDMEFEAFVKNREKVYSVVFCLLIIGEVVKNIPEAIKEKYPEIPWRRIAGMRDKLIHGYFTVDFEKVWETVKRDLPPLKKTVNKILKKIGQ